MNEMDHVHEASIAQANEQRRLAAVASDMIAASFGGASPVAHAIWVRTEVGEDGEFVNRICASVRPGCEHIVTVPDEHQGEKITLIPWPEDG